MKEISWWFDRVEFARGDDSALPVIPKAVERERGRLEGIFLILPRPAGAGAEGNRREIRRQLPALHDGESGKGSRDTAIWLTVLAATRRAVPNLVFFVSRDRGFVAKGGRRPLHPELRNEALQADAANLVFYADVEQLIDRLSCQAALPEPAESLVEREPVQTAIRGIPAERGSAH